MKEDSINVELNYVDNIGVLWTPLYDEAGKNLIKTAEQCFLDNEQAKLNPPQPKPQEPSQQDTLNAQLLKDNASMKVEINSQKALNSQLLLEIAKLKGGTTNV